MTELSELEGADRLVYLLDKRMHEWEQAEPRSRKEHEAAEGFTRLWAELKAVLSAGGELPAEWGTAQAPSVPVTYVIDQMFMIEGRMLSGAQLRELVKSAGEIFPVKELLGAHTVAVPLDRKDSML